MKRFQLGCLNIEENKWNERFYFRVIEIIRSIFLIEVIGRYVFSFVQKSAMHRSTQRFLDLEWVSKYLLKYRLLQLHVTRWVGLRFSID